MKENLIINGKLNLNLIKSFKEVPKLKIEGKIIDFSKQILFYQKNVDNFEIFNEIFIKKEEYEVAIKKTEYENNVSEKLQLIEEKYLYIENEIENYMKPNSEHYKQYYEEWENGKGKDFAVKGYSFDELVKDLEELIPNDEVLKITGKDKKNFILVLYLFQTDHFLKDYI